MASARLIVATLTLVLLSTASQAIVIGPGDVVTADFSLGSAPTGYSEMFSEVGFNQPGLEDFQYTIYDGNVSVYSQHVNTLNASYTQFWIANPITTPNFHLVVDQVASTFNIDVFNVTFFNYLPIINYPDYANATSLQAFAPGLNVQFPNHFQVTVVPEPPALVLMLVGFAALAFAISRRRARITNRRVRDCGAAA